MPCNAGARAARFGLSGSFVNDLNPEKLAAAAPVESELAQVQRLGWLLDQLKQTSLADALHSPLGARPALPRTKLDAAGTWGGYPTQNRWRVVENASPQSDL